MQESDPQSKRERIYAHTKTPSDGTPAPEEEWEPLYSEECGLTGFLGRSEAYEV